MGAISHKEEIKLGNSSGYRDYYPAGSRLDLEFRTVFLVLHMARSWTKFVERLLQSTTGQRRARWEALLAIAFADGPTTASEVAQRMGVQWPAIVRILDALEQDGLIRRRSNPTDGRSRLIELTGSGRDVIQSAQDVVDPARADLLSQMSDAELQSTIALVGRILGTCAPDEQAHPEGAR